VARARRFGPSARLVFRAGAPLARLLGRAWVDFEVTGPGRIPRSGPLVVAANHLSHIDPVIVSAVVQRPIRFLAVDELFGRSRAFDTLTTWLGAVPMTRVRVPLGAMRSALEWLEAGETVGLFPEGRRVGYWGEDPPKRGAAWLALRTGAPLLPIAIEGTDAMMSRDEPRLRRAPVRAWVGEPLDPDGYLDHVDPVGDLTEAWRTVMDGWLGRVAERG
jgi:1-acyl-sn-glycerol-3-phosphate acyltransferase